MGPLQKCESCQVRVVGVGGGGVGGGGGGGGGGETVRKTD